MKRQTQTPTVFALGLGLTNDCDLACAHCYRETLRIDRLSLEEVKVACKSLPLRSVNLGTGENGLHPQFSEILEYLRTLDVKRSITSNGYSVSVLTDEQLLSFHSVEFSLDFPTEAEQDAFQRPGDYFAGVALRPFTPDVALSNTAPEHLAQARPLLAEWRA